MRLILIASDARSAAIADRCGVDVIMVDLEIMGKEARQGHLDTVISRHGPDDIAIVRAACQRAQVLVRINPLHSGSLEEINQAIALGADEIMLPMATTPGEASAFAALVAGRARTVFLLETVAAMARASEIARVPGIDRIHVGFNDLHLQAGLTFMFELLSGGLIDHLAALFKEAGMPFGFGGVARVGMGTISAEMILAEHVRLGSSQVILSRDFRRCFQAEELEGDEERFGGEIQRLRQLQSELSSVDAEALLQRRDAFRDQVRSLHPSIYSLTPYPVE